MGRDADIVVVGAGITGLATARVLAQSGRGVILVEQFGLGHDRGSSHGASRIFRLSYPDPHYVRLAQGALQGWRELEAECGEELIVSTGGLDFGAGRRRERSRARVVWGPPRAPHRGAGEGAMADRRGNERAGALPTRTGDDLADRAFAALHTAAVAAGAVVLEHTARPRARARQRSSFGSGPTATRSWHEHAWWRREHGPETSSSESRSSCRSSSRAKRSRTSSSRTRSPFLRSSTMPYPTREEHGLRRPGLVSYALAAPGFGLKAGLHHAGPAVDPDDPGAPDPAVIRWVSAWAARRYLELDPGTDRRGNLSLHQHRRRVVHSRAPRSYRRRIRLLGARLQVRARVRPDDRCSGGRRGFLTWTS